MNKQNLLRLRKKYFDTKLAYKLALNTGDKALITQAWYNMRRAWELYRKVRSKKLFEADEVKIECPAVDTVENISIFHQK